MKSKFLLSALWLIPEIALGACNLELATAAGKYLAALERARLTRYQNSSVCEVLDYEFWNCTEKQKAELDKAIKFRETLGSYCQPHLRPPKDVLGQLETMKGVALFSWRDYNGYHWYALLSGTNRKVTGKELVENKVTEGYLKQVLKSVPAGTEIDWNNSVTFSAEEKAGVELSLPPAEIVKSIRAQAPQAKLSLITDRSGE